MSYPSLWILADVELLLLMKVSSLFYIKEAEEHLKALI